MGQLGFYEQPEQRVPVKSIRLAFEVPESERTNLEVLRTDTPLFTRYIEARRNRREEWFTTPAGHIDVCNIAIPVRDAAGEIGAAPRHRISFRMRLVGVAIACWQFARLP
jgi:peptidylprolyl isomerase